MSEFVITRDMAQKVLTTVDAGLVSGLGKPVPGQMCVEAAVCFAMGLPHSDEPSCVSPALRNLKIRLNDSQWSAPQARANGLRRLALAQLGSAGALDEPAFVRRVVEMTIRTVVPEALRAAARVAPDAHRPPLLAAADRCEREGTRDSSLNARRVAANAVNAVNAANAANAVNAAAADAAADAAAYAAAAAANAADAAAYADAAYAADAAANAAANAAYAVNAADAAARTRDRVLSEYAERVVQILIDMGAPGCQWLDLAPLEVSA